MKLLKKKQSSSKGPTKLLEFRSYDEKSIFEINHFKNSSTGITSDFFEETIVLDDFLSTGWRSIEIIFEKNETSSPFFVLKKNDKKISERKMKIDLQTMKEKRIRVFKFDDQTQIKNIFFYQNQPSQIYAILSELNERSEQYALFGDGSKSKAEIVLPENLADNADGFKHALVNGQLHLFGGKKDGKMVVCRIFRFCYHFVDSQG